MGKYSIKDYDTTKTCCARGSYLRVHFKTTRETAQALRQRSLPGAVKYLKDVIDHKQIVPFRRFVRGLGRHAQAKQFKTSGSTGRWPEKSCRFLLDLLKNAESNAKAKNLTVENMRITHIQASSGAHAAAAAGGHVRVLTRGVVAGEPGAAHSAADVPRARPDQRLPELALPH